MNIRRLLTLGFAALFPLCFNLPSALADGGILSHTEYAEEGLTADQRAIIIYDEGVETLIVDTEYSGSTPDFAWVIPCPVTVAIEDVGFVKTNVFDLLEQHTVPRAEITDGYYGCFGCGGGDETNEYTELGVTVFGRTSIGDYDIAVVGAEQGIGLQAWLNANDFAFTDDSAEILDYYTARDYSFVAVKYSGNEDDGDSPANDVTDTVTGEDIQQDTRLPLYFSFVTDTPVFPMHISRLSTVEEVEVLIYLLSPEGHFYKSSNYFTMDMPHIETDEANQFAADYEAAFRRSLSLHDNHGLVVEMATNETKMEDIWWGKIYSLPEDQIADAIDNAYSELRVDYLDSGMAAVLGFDTEFNLTRFRTYLEPENMDEDIFFKLDDDRDYYYPYHRIMPLTSAGLIDDLDGPRLATSAMLFLGSMMLMMAVGPRRRSFAKLAVLTLILAALVI